jgi:sortase A
MRSGWRGELPLVLTMPLDVRRRPRGARRRRAPRAALAALLALGAALLAAGLWLPAKAALAQQLLNRAWSATAAHSGGVPSRPWPWADTWPVARLTLPGARESLTVLAGASGRNLAFAPALIDGSATPGSRGVSVIAGHRDTHFRGLANVGVGDELTIERPDGAVLTYEVTALDVVDSSRADLRLDADDSYVALVTCWPFDDVTVGGSWRYVVTARLRL